VVSKPFDSIFFFLKFLFYKMMELLVYKRVHQKRSWQQQQWEQQQLAQILEKCAEIQKMLEKCDQTNQEIKASRLEFPTFNGKDPDSWCYRAEQFFDFYEIPERRKLGITAFHIEGKASSWFRALRTTNECITWYEFVRAMQAQFSKAEEIILLDDDSKAKESIVENSMERVEEAELVLKEFKSMELEKIHPVLEKLDTQVESLGFVDVKPKDVHNDASLPCEFASQVMDNSFFLSKIDEYGPSVVNQEGVMSSSYNTQTDSSEMKGNKQVSDDILAKIGSKVQPKEGLKLNPVGDFDEKSDSTIKNCLPDEDSLITFDDYCFLPDEDSLITGAVQQAEIESWSSFVFQYSKEDEVHVFYLKHRWRWKIIGGILWNGHAGAAPESAHCSAPVNKAKVF
jgi:hypothetical protein